MTHTEQFLHRILIDSAIQQAITSLRFDHIQAVAAQYGYTLSAADMDAALSRDPQLAAQIDELIAASELEFELDEAEMALIAGGGGGNNCTTDGRGSNSSDQSLRSSIVFKGL